MKHILIKVTIAAILTIALLYIPTANAQSQTNTTAKVNMTALKIPGNTTEKVNTTILKVLSNTTPQLNMTTKTPGNTTAKLNQSASESTNNNTATNILNKTEDFGKKIAGGLGSLLGNASQKLKEGSK
jgi:predicted secreted Zn-dependent protease